MARRPPGSHAGAAPQTGPLSRSRCAGQRTPVGAERHDARRHGQERCPGRDDRTRTMDVGVGRRCPSFCPRRHRTLRGAMERAVCRDRDRHRDRRPRRVGRRRAAAAPGGGHLSRHRDLGRQHRDPGRPAPGRVSPGGMPRSRGDDRRHWPARRICACRRRRRVGRARDADGDRVLRCPRLRSAEPAVERAVGCGSHPGCGRASLDCRSRFRSDVWRDARHSRRGPAA